MNQIFKTEKFWELYFNLESGNVSEADVAVQLDFLGKDFEVYEENIGFEPDGPEQIEINRTVEFRFFCGENFSLALEYTPDAFGGSKTLFLIDSNSKTKAQLGWWDLARWHPYCLRPNELDLLLKYWSRFDERWSSSELPLLLLAQFVGLSEPRGELIDQVKFAFAELGLPEPSNEQLTTLLHVLNEDEYEWQFDSELGWVFTSSEYCCYSLRNRAHSNSEEGTFPFAEFREMIRQIEKELT